MEDLISKALQEIPDYQTFLTVDQLAASTRRLAQTHPKTVERLVIGHSRQGEPIEALKVGNGPRRAVLFGCPHPNEPIGAMMLEYLGQRLAEDKPLCDGLGFTWYLVKCIDPDGTRLNQGWFKGPFSPGHYARHYYRPPSHQQVEWTFPVHYKDLEFDRPLPETRALMSLLERTRPHLVYSLHNAGFGGVYYYLSDPAPALYPVLHRLPEKEGLPLALGEPEIPCARVFAPAIYEMPSITTIYDYYQQYSEVSPARLITGGTSSRDYAKEVSPGCLVLVCEMPYYYNPRVVDLAPTGLTRREAIISNVEESQEFLDHLKVQYGRALPELSERSPFMDTIEQYLDTIPRTLVVMRRWAEESPECARPATVAEVFDNLEVSKFQRLLFGGLLLRAVEYQLARRPSCPLDQLKQELVAAFRSWEQQLESTLRYEVIPICSLVRIQLGSALYTAAYLSGPG
ncbi:MAG: M14 family zinc carboxypeptidase [Bacillota bacterium]